MDILGWFVVSIVALLVTVVAGIVFYIDLTLRGRLSTEGVILSCVSVVLWWISSCSAPFEILMR